MGTSAMIGADPDALDRLGVSLRRVAGQLSSTDREVLAMVRAARWNGAVADRFRASWPGSCGASLRRASDVLTLMAKELKQQADDQRRASSADSGGTWGGDIGHWLLRGGAWLLHASAMQRWVASEGRPALDRMRNASAAEQKAWWSSLTEEQRQALLRNEPGRLTGLKGLDRGVLAEARQRYSEQVSKDLVRRSHSESVSGGVRIPIPRTPVKIDLGATGSGSLTTMEDGSATVSLSLAAKVAAQLGLKSDSGPEGAVELSQQPKVEAVYRFDSVEEAKAFLEGLRKEAIPSGKEWFQAAVPGLLATDGIGDVASYLAGHQGNLEAMTAEVRFGRGASIGIAGNNVAIDAGAGGRYDLVSGDTTAFVNGSVDASAALAGTGFKGSGAVEAAVTMNDWQLSKLSLSGTLQGTAGPSLGGIELQAGGRAAFGASIDLTDAATRDAAEGYLDAVSHGRISQANQHLSYLLAQSDLVVTVDQVESGGVGFDKTFVHGSTESTTSTNQLTFLRPPGGDWFQYEGSDSAGTRAGGGGGGGGGGGPS